MGQPPPEQKDYTIDEWLALEQETGERYEYHFGEVFAMAGGTLNHTRIGRNALFELENHFRRSKRPCEAFQAVLKVEIKPNGRYVYPDTLAICGDIDASDKVSGAVKNPVLVIEVVSESSGAYDRGVKFKYYRQLPTVLEYLILEQTDVAATLYRRSGAGDLFVRHEYEGPEAELRLESVGLALPLGRLYRSVQFGEGAGEQ